jgi:LuxR family transcriptional regulator, maltose regulon positive regulatory protein
MLHFWAPEVIADLCARALEAGIEPEHVRELIRKLRLTPPVSSSAIEGWPWALEIRTLGGFAIRQDANPLRFSGKGQQKPVAMLKVLIALGGNGVPVVAASDLLWPDAEGGAAHSSVTVTLHRLRRLVNRADAVRLSEGRLSLDERICWVDAWAFEQFLAEADRAWRDGVAQQAADLTEKAIRLYGGPFMGQEAEEPWALSMAERLRSKFLRGVRKLGDYWSEAGRWDKAAECYEKGLEVDEIAESFCRALMFCYGRLDRRAEALALYDRFERRLETVLGVEPTARTRAVRDSLAGRHAR